MSHDGQAFAFQADQMGPNCRTHLQGVITAMRELPYMGAVGPKFDHSLPDE